MIVKVLRFWPLAYNFFLLYYLCYLCFLTLLLRFLYGLLKMEISILFSSRDAVIVWNKISFGIDPSTFAIKPIQ
jgi:hypothetical protein